MTGASADRANCGIIGMELRTRRGQAMIEYVLVLACLLGVVTLLWACFVPAVEKSARRAQNLVTADCP